MTRIATRVLLAIVMGWTMAALAATPRIGIATAQGGFWVDKAPVSGNATLFDGTELEAGLSPSTVRMENGATLHLAAGSKGRIYRDRLVLAKGSGQMEHASRFRLEAGNLSIQPASAGTARVALDGSDRIQVEALSSPVTVTTSAGTLIASIDAGSGLAFDTQPAGASAPFQVTGCLSSAGLSVLLTDETAGVSFDLRGSGLEKYAGRRVEISGVSAGRRGQAAAGAMEVVDVVRIHAVAGACPAPAAKTSSKNAAKAGKPALGAAGKTVIAGVVVAAVVAGAAVAIADEEAPSTVSR